METLFKSRFQVLTLVGVVLSSCYLTLLSSVKAEDYTGVYYVSVDGNDEENTGSQESPFASLEKARDTIRAERSKGEGGIYCVNIGKGTYVRTTPFELTDVDSYTKYIGSPDGTIISAGREIKNWTVATAEQKENFPCNDAEIWRAELPQINGTPVYFEQLFVGERRAVRSRFPNEGFLRPQVVAEKLSESSEPKFAYQDIQAKEGDLNELHLEELTAEELRFGQFVIHHHWDTTRRIILGFSEKDNVLHFQGAPMKRWNPWRETSMYYLENLRSSFDRPGEWFYSGVEGCVYYRPLPNEKIDKVKFVAPVSCVNQLLIVSGTPTNSVEESKHVQDIQFENLQFSYTDAPRRESVMKEAGIDVTMTGDLKDPGPSQFEPAQAASFTVAVIEITNAAKITLKNCKVSHIGEYGLWFRNCRDCVAVDSEFIDLGAGAVRIGGGQLDLRNKIQNCILAHGGRVFAAATGVWIGQNTEEIEIIHNDINDFFYTGVSVGWVWGYNGGHAFNNKIEFNHIWNIGQGQMSDMGGIYTLGTSTGTRVCNNVIHDVSSYAYGGWGLYPDEGSEGILFENNLVYDTTDGSFHQHYGKENIVRNNILARSRINPARIGNLPHQIAITRVEDHLSTTFERNIIYWEEGIALGYNADKARAIYRKNLWFNTSGEATFAGKTHDDWAKESGKDIDGLVADPLFVDPTANNFNLRPGSPAEKIGFIPFDYSKAGVVK